MGKTKGDFSTGDDGGAASPFAALEGLRGELPEGKAAPAGQDPDSSARFAPKVVIRRERSGRGGKTVTVVEGVLLEGAPRDAFVKGLRKALGTSGRVEGDRLVFSGDVGDRLAEEFTRAGAPRIVRGN